MVNISAPITIEQTTIVAPISIVRPAVSASLSPGFAPANIPVLVALSDVDGVLKYKGSAIVGDKGEVGLSTYEVALANGFVGTEEAWLASLMGQSTYEVALANGFVGTVIEWLASLVGPPSYAPPNEEVLDGLSDNEGVLQYGGQAVGTVPSNEAVLDGLSDDEGILQYNGQPIRTVIAPADRAAWMGMWFGRQVEYDALDPSVKSTYEEWLLAGTGFFEFHIIPDEVPIIEYIVTALTVHMLLSTNVPSVAIARAVEGITASPTIETLNPSVAVSRAVTGMLADLLLSGDNSAVSISRSVQGVTGDLQLIAGLPSVSVALAGSIATALAGVIAELSLIADVPTAVVARAVAGVLASASLSGNIPSVGVVKNIMGITAEASLVAGLPVVSVEVVGVSVPTTPSLNITSGIALQVVLDWADVAEATSYDVWRHSATFTPPSGTLVGADVAVSTFTELTTEAQYFYRVIAKNTAGSSAPSNEITVTTVAVPAEPTLQSVTSSAQTQIEANWSDVSGATSYNLYYKKDSAPTGAETGETTSSGKITGIAVSNKTLSGLLDYTYYYIKVSAVNAAGEGTLSTYMYVRTPFADVTAPVVTSFNGTANGMTLTITSLVATDVVGVTGYKIGETNTAPTSTEGASSGRTAWLSSPPATYTVTTAGTRILYAWAKDAAGNVSAYVTKLATYGQLSAAPVITATTINPTTVHIGFNVPATAIGMKIYGYQAEGTQDATTIIANGIQLRISPATTVTPQPFVHTIEAFAAWSYVALACNAFGDSTPSNVISVGSVTSDTGVSGWSYPDGSAADPLPLYGAGEWSTIGIRKRLNLTAGTISLNGESHDEGSIAMVISTNNPANADDATWTGPLINLQDEQAGNFTYNNTSYTGQRWVQFYINSSDAEGFALYSFSIPIY